MLYGFYWHTVLKWSFMEVERDLPESLCIPLEAAPPYCNFLLEAYLEQPETALQQGLPTLVLLTCCHFITVSISFCLFFCLHAPEQCHTRYSGGSSTQTSVTKTISHPPPSLSLDRSVNQQTLRVYCTLDFLIDLNTNDSRTQLFNAAEKETYGKTSEFCLSPSPTDAPCTAHFSPHAEKAKVLVSAAAGLSRQKKKKTSKWYWYFGNKFAQTSDFRKDPSFRYSLYVWWGGGVLQPLVCYIFTTSACRHHDWPAGCIFMKKINK